MFIEYTKLVLRRYEEKRADGTLSQRLLHPTPAQLKEECEAVYPARHDRKDQRTLNAFFGEVSEGETGLKAIRRCDTTKFKPLRNYLLSKTQNTEDKNIELLAWLIDFDQRPYEYGKVYVSENTRSDHDGVNKKTDEAASGGEPAVQPQSFASVEKQPGEIVTLQTDTHIKWPHPKIKAGIIVIIILILAGAVAYWLQKNKSEPLGLMNIKAGEACMYWVSDHYEQVSCSQQHGDTLTVALDTFRLRHFKKINKTDTITENAIGRVWYIKTNNQIECFTSDGYYPLDPKRKLKPLTDYIIRKYIHPAH